MVKITFPLQSLSASGSIMETLTFSRRAKCQQVRLQRKQSDRFSESQKTQRSFFSLASLSARKKDYGDSALGVSLYGVDVEFYKEQVANLPLTWYNFAISTYPK